MRGRKAVDPVKDGIIELYGDGDLERLRQSIRRHTGAHLALAAAALAVCIILIAHTGTANAARMELLTIAVSTVAGWIVLYGQILVVTPLRRELRHALMLRSEEREAVTGVVSVTGERVSIRKSITARRVEARGEDGTVRLLVCENRADALAGLGAATLYTAHGYVAAYEVTA